MNDLSVIDRFLDTFSRYIDSGFGLLQPEIAYLSTTLVAIDITLAGLFWAMAGEEVMPRLVKKILYVGAFAFIITNFNFAFRHHLQVVRRAGPQGVRRVDRGQDQLLQPGRLAHRRRAGRAAHADRDWQARRLPVRVFTNIDTIVVLFIAWIIVIISFFILAVQLFVSVLEFKLTTLAGFVLVPFALWNKTSLSCREGARQRRRLRRQGAGAGRHRRHRHGPVQPVPVGRRDRPQHQRGARHRAGRDRAPGPWHLRSRHRQRPRLRRAATRRRLRRRRGTRPALGLIVAGGAGAARRPRRLAGGAAMGSMRAATSLAGGARSAYGEGAAASGASGLGRAGAGMAGMARAGASARPATASVRPLAAPGPAVLPGREATGTGSREAGAPDAPGGSRAALGEEPAPRRAHPARRRDCRPHACARATAAAPARHPRSARDEEI